MNYDIEALKRKMLVKYPFFGSVVAGVDYKEDSTEPTAATDGKVIYYNPEFLNSISKEEQIFVFAHEVCHIAFNHILRSEGKDEDLWNIATDAVINQFLKRDGAALVDGVVDIEEAINYTAEDFYQKLQNEQEQKQQSEQKNKKNNQNANNSSQPNGNNTQNTNQSTSNENQSQNSENQSQSNENKPQSNENKSQNGENTKNDSNKSQQEDDSKNKNGSTQKNKDKSCDANDNKQKDDKLSNNTSTNSHSRWKDAIKKHKEKKQTDEREKSKNDIKQKQKELEKMGEKKAFDKNKEIKQKQLDDLKKEILNKVSHAGNQTDSINRTVDIIGSSKPIIDWRYALREAIKYDVDWSYKNATIEDGIVTPHLEEQPLPETEIVLDTSGSINEDLLRGFLRETKNILKHSKLKVGCFDTIFFGFHDIRTEADIDKMEFIGGGGTDFNVAVNAFSRRVENKIIFTDGYGDIPAKPVNAIWIVFGNTEFKPKVGRVIHISPEQLFKLCTSSPLTTPKGKSL